MSLPQAVRGASRRGFRLTTERTLVINLHGAPERDYVEVVPQYIEGVGPALVFYDVMHGREPELRRHLMTLTANGSRLLCRYLPVLVNTASRMRQQQT